MNLRTFTKEYIEIMKPINEKILKYVEDNSEEEDYFDFLIEIGISCYESVWKSVMKFI